MNISNESPILLSQCRTNQVCSSGKQTAEQDLGQAIPLTSVRTDCSFFRNDLATIFDIPMPSDLLYRKSEISVKMKTPTEKANYYESVHRELSEKLEAGVITQEGYDYESRLLDHIYDEQIKFGLIAVQAKMIVLSEGGYEALFESEDRLGKIEADLQTIFNNLRENIKSGGTVDSAIANKNAECITLADLDYLFSDEFDALLKSINEPKADLGLRGSFPKPRTVTQEEIEKIYGDAQKNVLGNKEISDFLKAAINQRLAFGAYFIQNRSSFDLSVKKFY
jgi:hypothetical protein